MKVAIVLNGISRKKKLFYDEIFPVLKKQFDVEVFETQFAGHAIQIAATLATCNYILAAGGDGTLHQVLNGILQNPNADKLQALGIIPLGTGNDFARTCGIHADGNQIANLLMQNRTKQIDVGQITCVNDEGMTHSKYFINECSLGMGPDVVRRLMNGNRSLGPSLTYLKAIVQTFFGLKAQEIFVQAPDWQWSGKVRVLAIANGRSFGNSIYIAPDADIDDGLFSTFLAGDFSTLNFLICLQKLKGKKKIDNRLIHYNKCSCIEVSSPTACPIEADGEWMGWLPMKTEILPGRINFLC